MIIISVPKDGGFCVTSSHIIILRAKMELEVGPVSQEICTETLRVQILQ